MENAGAVEMLMPALQPSELWKETNRWDNFGPELMRLHDRHHREFALGATHEEVITDLIRSEINSYKKLPLTLYQIQTKFRDEKRPRFGLLRGREFVMKDAYSFHTNDESLDEVYDRLFTAYSNIFKRCGLNFRAVTADSGAMGGKDTHEFMVLSEVGEDTIAYSDSSDYAANIEMAPVIDRYENTKQTEIDELALVSTPNQKTMVEVASFLNRPLDQGIKSLLFKIDEEFVLVLTRGDHDVNDIKLKHIYQAVEVELATEEEAKNLLGASVGSLGPVNVKNVEVIADYSVKSIVDGYCGANEDDKHYINVQPERDLVISKYEDIRFIKEGDLSPDGNGIIKFAKGIEVGHVFKLGKVYTEKMGANYLDEFGKSQVMTMGCYGIGVSRTLAAIVEQYNDENGITWPSAVAPYQIHMLTMQSNKEEQVELAEQIYTTLKENQIDVLYDDRKERPGVKFADSDLIGIPVRLTIGKKANEGIIECKIRATGEQFDIHISELLGRLQEVL